MITYELITEAQDYLVKNWGEDGKRVIEATARVDPFNDNFSAFLSHCSCCGGNWGAMILSGIDRLYPDVWEAIPHDMGNMAFTCLCYTLLLCGVDTSE